MSLKGQRNICVMKMVIPFVNVPIWIGRRSFVFATYLDIYDVMDYYGLPACFIWLQQCVIAQCNNTHDHAAR